MRCFQRSVEGARGGQHAGVLARAVIEDHKRFVHLVARRRRGGFVVGPVRTALQCGLVDPGATQQVADDLDVARLAVVRAGHDSDVLGAELVARGDPGTQAANRL